MLFLLLAVGALEDQKANLSRELSTLRHTHNKVRYTPRSDFFNKIWSFLSFSHFADVLFLSWLTRIGNF